jgi:hypothetical protein
MLGLPMGKTYCLIQSVKTDPINKLHVIRG